MEDLMALDDALRALASMGDLSMGQPLDHSQRVAALSAQMARHLGWDDTLARQVHETALLRWTGCTANATEVASTITDDVTGRALMLQLQFEKIEFLVPPQAVASRVLRVSSIHCDVSMLIARTLGLQPLVSACLGCVFEHWDGSGSPNALQGDAIPAPAMVVSVCSDLEILARLQGTAHAVSILRQRAGQIYPAHLVEIAAQHAPAWLDPSRPAEAAPQSPVSAPQIGMALIGSVIDLKLPWMCGHSQAVVDLVDGIAARMHLPRNKRMLLRQAAWFEGFNRLSIPNAIWCRAEPLAPADLERVRLGPYWTSRLGDYVPRLKEAAQIAASAHERLDGSGYFRGLNAQNTPLETRILAASVAWVDLTTRKPQREALGLAKARRQLLAEVAAGRLDERVVDQLLVAVSPGHETKTRRADPPALLTARELEVLRRVSLGESNKVVAQQLSISPSTVRAHMENIFIKLDCKTRAASTLKASVLGLF